MNYVSWSLLGVRCGDEKCQPPALRFISSPFSTFQHSPAQGWSSSWSPSQSQSQNQSLGQPTQRLLLVGWTASRWMALWTTVPLCPPLTSWYAVIRFKMTRFKLNEMWDWQGRSGCWEQLSHWTITFLKEGGVCSHFLFFLLAVMNRSSGTDELGFVSRLCVCLNCSSLL